MTTHRRAASASYRSIRQSSQKQDRQGTDKRRSDHCQNAYKQGHPTAVDDPNKVIPPTSSVPNK